MALNPIIPLGGIALLLMLAGKKGKGKQPQLPPPPLDVTPTPVPEPTDSGWTATPASPPETQQILVLLEDYRLPEGSALPEGLTDQQWRESLWIGVPGCNSWALGKEFKAKVLAPYLPKFYDAYVDITMQADPELALVPPDGWVDFQFITQSKTGGIVEDPYKVSVAKMVMDIYHGIYGACVEGIPEASDFASGEAYAQAWAAFAENNKNLYALYYNLAQYAKEHMTALYQQRFPEAAQEWMEREWANEAAYQEGMNLEDMTDWAYHHAYPECPEVIDPSNPEHDECKEAWVRLKSYIQEYL